MGIVVDRYGAIITRHENVEVRTSMFDSKAPTLQINYKPHPFEEEVLDTFTSLDPLLHPLYIAQDTQSYNLFQCYWEDDREFDKKNRVQRVNRVHRKSFKGNILECFPADRTDGLKIDIIDNALLMQARSFELFSKPSLVYQTGVIVPENSDLEKRLVSTNNLIRHRSSVPKSSLYTVNWEKYFINDPLRFEDLKRRAREQHELSLSLDK